MNTESPDRRRVLVGFDGSPDAAGAIELTAQLLPGRTAVIAHLWAPPYARPELRSRVSRRAGSVKEMIELLEREALAEAERVAAEGVTLAAAAGWRAEPLVRRSLGGVGLELAALAEELVPAVLVIGSRGLTGVRAVLGSVSDEAVHASPVPVLVVPRFILTAEREAAGSGPVLVGHDGSAGAARALDAAASLLGERERIAAFVGEEDAAPAAPEGARTAVLAPLGVSENARAIADALVRHAQEAGAAVIVVGSRGRSAIREILLGSVAIAVLHHADRPVMVVPAR